MQAKKMSNDENLEVNAVKNPREVSLDSNSNFGKIEKSHQVALLLKNLEKTY